MIMLIESLRTYSAEVLGMPGSPGTKYEFYDSVHHEDSWPSVAAMIAHKRQYDAFKRCATVIENGFFEHTANPSGLRQRVTLHASNDAALSWLRNNRWRPFRWRRIEGESA